MWEYDDHLYHRKVDSMELHHMQYVLAVADAKSFSLAAQNCHLGQPALSQQIAKLERELGVALFYRNPRNVMLTQAGETFVLRAREILQLTETLQAEMDANPQLVQNDGY